jgi:hypothetical protein
MKCSEAEEKMLLELSGELEPEEKTQLDRHLAECKRCREASNSICSMLEALGSPSAMPQVLENRILAAVRMQGPKHREISPLLKIVRDFAAAAAVSVAALLLFFLLAPEPEIARPAMPAGREARVVEHLPQEQASVTQEEVSREISRIGTSSTKILDGTFSQQAEQAWDNVEATRFLLTTPGRAGLEKEINTVKSKILKLRDEMTALALYTGPENQNSILDNGR